MRFTALVVLLSALLLGATGLDAFSKDEPTPAPAPTRLRVAVLNEDLPESDPGLAEALQTAIGREADAKLVSSDDLVKGLEPNSTSFDLVVFPNAEYLPADLADPLVSFVKNGGDMIAIGGPAFSEIVTKSGGRWSAGSKTDVTPPVLESLSPSYKTYSVKAARLTPNEPYAGWAFGSEITGPVDVVCPIPRSRGLGIGGTRTFRWIPLLYALDEKGDQKGAAAALTLNQNDSASSVWGYIGFRGESRRDVICSAAAKMVGRISEGSFLLSGGMDRFGYWMGNRAEVGGDIFRPGRMSESVMKVTILSSVGPIVYEKQIRMRLTEKAAASGLSALRSREWKADWNGRFIAKVQLMDGDKVIDTISHEFTVVDAARKRTDFVTVRGGDFYLNGKKWYPLGINYWPIYVSGVEPPNNWGGWLSPNRYDPEVVERELSSIKDLGMNMVSIQYTNADYAPALIDFLGRCRENGLKVNVYVEGFHPLTDERPLPGLELIKAAKLDQNDAVFAYDIGWEVHAGSENDRAKRDKDWQDWVIERYGSVENAFKDWNFKPEVKDDVISGPTDQQLTTDGDWRVMVAAYRRFWDDFISRRYAYVVKEVRAVDPVHLIGARSGYGGMGQAGIAAEFPFDLASGVKHLDFVSPEAWGLHPDWPSMQTGGFTTLYARFVSGGKPVFWAENGYSIRPKNDAAQVDRQKGYYAAFYRMLAESGANGCAGWWWPGGLRVGEKSDYGIVGPNDLPRPAALLAKGAEATLVKSGPRPQPNYWIVIDRDRYVNGYAGVWDAAKAEYTGALNSGSVPGLKTEGTGTTSATAPHVAVGNTPLTENNPPKYLNAEYNSVEAMTSHKHWLEPSEAVFHVGRRKPLRIRLSVGNTGEAEWLALPADQEGAIVLNVTTSTGETHRYPIPKNVPMFGDLNTGELDVVPSVTSAMTVTLQMEAVGVARFGEKVNITVAP